MKWGYWIYRAYKAYFKILNNYLLYRRVYLVGKENIPCEGEPLMVVSNHQNNANDALGLILLFKNRQYPTTSTSGVFLAKVPFLRAFFRGLGILPAYRADYEGMENVEKNRKSMEEMERRLMQGRPVIIYPEGTGQFGRYLGSFIPNYLRIAFRAAERDGWQQDVKVLPTANHYSDYFDVQTEFMISVGEPVSLMPYYERYKEKPRTTMREVNEVLHERVKEMMLHVEDREHYEAIDFLRNSAFGDAFAGGRLPLPERLEKDRAFVKRLEEAGNDVLYDKVMKLKGKEDSYGLRDQWVAERAGWVRTLADGVLELILLPLWLVSLWPHGLLYRLPMLLLGENRMYTNTYRVLVGSLLLVPVAMLTTLCVAGGAGVFWWGVMWIVLWIPQARFAWWMWMRLKRTRGRLFILTHGPERRALEALRGEVAKELWRE